MTTKTNKKIGIMNYRIRLINNTVSIIKKMRLRFNKIEKINIPIIKAPLSPLSSLSLKEEVKAGSPKRGENTLLKVQEIVLNSSKQEQPCEARELIDLKPVLNPGLSKISLKVKNSEHLHQNLLDPFSLMDISIVEDKNENINKENKVPSIYTLKGKDLLEMNLSELSVAQALSLLNIFNGNIATSKKINYQFKKGAHILVSKAKSKKNYEPIVKILRSFFAYYSCLISKPIFFISNKKVIIRLFFFSGSNKYQNRWSNLLLKIKHSPSSQNKRLFSFYRKPLGKNLLSVNEKSFATLISCLSRILRKKVEIQMIQLQNPFHEPYILAQTLAINTKKYSLSKILFFLWKKMIMFRPTVLNINQKLNFTPKTILPINADALYPSAEIDSSYLLQLTEPKGKEGKDTTLESSAPSLQNKQNKSPLAEIQDSVSEENKDFKNHSRILELRKIVKLLQESNENKERIIFSSLSNNTGVKIKLGGRLATEKIIPRKTVKISQKGSFVKGKVDFVDRALYTSKNKRGAFSIKILMSNRMKKPYLDFK